MKKFKRQSLCKSIYLKIQFEMCDRMTEHGTQKPSAWYALGLKIVIDN